MEYTNLQLRQMLARHEAASLGYVDVARVEGSPSRDEPPYSQLIGAVGVQTPQEYGPICDTLNADYRRHAERDEKTMDLLAIAHNALPILIEEIVRRRGDSEDDHECTRCNSSGEIAVRCTFPMTEVGPGPVPDYSKGITGSKCPDCDGTGIAKAEGRTA